MAWLAKICELRHIFIFPYVGKEIAIHTPDCDVAAGAEQVSSGAITLSQGSTEQAAEVETLAGHIGAVSDSVHKAAKGAQEASRISEEVKKGLLSSNEKMQNMTGRFRLKN